jgi:hypothetical protein
MYRTLALTLSLVALLTMVPATPAGDATKLKPINLDKINTAADEVDPFASADGKNLLYASNAGGHFNLFASTRNGTTWSAGKPLTATNSKDADTRSPFFTKGGVLYFATNVVPDPKFKGLKNYDLKVKESGRAALPILGISTKHDELHPWITASGKELYFSRELDEGWKLYVAQGPVPGPITEAVSVGFPVDFHHATVTSNALTMYLQGPLENGRWGLFVSKRAKVGAKWSAPEALTALNDSRGPRGDTCPSLSADDRMLYFASDRPGGKGGMDLWVIPTAQLKGK